MGATINQGQARYWLLVGGTPYGPFTVDQIDTRLGCGEVTWETQACPLGSRTGAPNVRRAGPSTDWLGVTVHTLSLSSELLDSLTPPGATAAAGLEP